MSPVLEMNPAETKALINAVLDIADKKVRRRGLERSVRAAASIQLRAMRSLAKDRTLTGTLVKSLGSKVASNKERTRASAITGPRTKYRGGGKVSLLHLMQLRDVRRELARQTDSKGRKNQRENLALLASLGENFSKKEMARVPTRYAHLAGPKRKSTFVQQAVAQTRNQVEAAMAAKLAEAIEGK